MAYGFQHRPRTIIVIFFVLLFLCGVSVLAATAGNQGSGDEQQSYSSISHWPDSEMAPQPLRTAPKDLPRFEVTKGSGSTGEGFIFMSPFEFGAVGRSAPYLLILDNNAEPVYYQRFDKLPIVMDFKQHKNGQLTYYDRIRSEFIALNNQYEIEGSYAAGNSYSADLHDLQILDNDHVLLLIYNETVVDMSEIVEGGHPEAVVIDCIVQELDAQANVVFEWHGLDHIDILDSTRDFTADRINYMNCNSIEQDYDGNLILSSRNLDEITKIDRQTGEIIWRMGGKKNEFEFTNDTGFWRQHDARRLENGYMTMYDNGVFHTPVHSRGLEVEVDEINKTVTVVRTFRNTPDAYAGAMGNMQRLPNQNTVIGWGRSSRPTFTEFDIQGEKVLEFNAVRDLGSYRVFRFPWQGFPTWPPALIAYADGQDVELYFSWNGSTETSGYMIFASLEGGEEWHVATVAKDGFENEYKFQVPTEGVWDFRVVAVDKESMPSESSNVVKLLIGGSSNYLPVLIAE